GDEVEAVSEIILPSQADVLADEGHSGRVIQNRSAGLCRGLCGLPAAFAGRARQGLVRKGKMPGLPTNGVGTATNQRKARRYTSQEDRKVSNGGRREVARDPQDLEPFFVSRQRAGDVDGMMALYEPAAVVDPGNGQLLRGLDAIRAFFEHVVASVQKYNYGEQRPALISGDLAMTSMRSPGGNVTTEIARRQPDGTWLWVIDRFIVT